MRPVDDVRFHCPVANCLYYTGSERHFKSKRLLDQHLLKVHAEKKFMCTKCSKGFPSKWQQTYHEKTCGVIWKCNCGHEYNSRETLLTHSRRTGHDLPSDMLPSKRKSTSVKQQQLVVMPVAIVIQNISLPHQMEKNDAKETSSVASGTAPRRILPKTTSQSTPSTKHFPFQLTESVSNKVSISTQTDMKCNCEKNTAVSTETNDSEKTGWAENKKERSARRQSVKNAAGTQTCKRCIIQKAMKSARIPVVLESRGSQCSPRIRCHYRSRKPIVDRGHMETQTTESVVGRMKKPGRTKVFGRARRSLGSTLEQSKESPKEQMDQAAQSAWSSLDLILGSQWMQRCSSGTQTSPRSSFYREMCDSQTLTDEMLPPLVNTLCEFDSAEPSEANDCSLLETVVQQLNSSLSTDMNQETAFLREPTTIAMPDSTSIMQREQADSSYSLFNYMYDDIYENAPALSHMETQTCEELGFDFLTNMETQTTDDFFNDLELSDIQTQTPWTDLLDFCENLDTSQLSAAIQTDITGQHFSALDDKFRKEFDSMDMETQTHCNSTSAEFTNSYTQTLTLSSYFHLT